MGELKNILLEEITVSKNNPRKHTDEQKLKDLVASIKEKGVIEPIIVRLVGSKGYEVVCGERRVKAAKLAGLEEISAVVRLLDDKQALEFQVIENLQREDVHPLEEAEGYELLMKKHGYKTVDDIAVKVGKSKGYIYGRMKLCDLIPENRKFFYDGKFSPSVALLVARVPAHLQKEAGKAIIKNEDYWDEDDVPMTYKQAKEYIEENFMLQLKEAQFDIKEKGLGGKVSCSECPKRTGNQKELFADMAGADRCADPACFKAKKEAFTQRTINDLKKKGKIVLSQEEADTAFRYGGDSPSGKYISLDEHDWSWPEGVTARKMLKASKDVKTVHGINPQSGKIVEMVSRTDLPKLFKAAGIKTDKPVNTSQKVSENKKNERIDAAKRAFCIEKINKNMDQRVKNVLILSALLDRVGSLDGAPMDDEYEDIYNLGDDKVKALIEKCFPGKVENIQVTEYLEFLSGKLGFTMAKDYVITKDYLEACTKDELVKLIKELGMSFAQEDTTKKDVLVEYILKHAPKGKVPKELISSKK